MANIKRLYLTRLIHLDSQDAFYLSMRELNRKGYAEIPELYLTGRLGTVKTRCSINRYTGEGEELIRIAFLDLTHFRTEEEARREAELKKQLDLMNLMFQQSLTGIYFMMLDEPVKWNNSVDKEKVLDYIFEHQRVTRVNQAMLDQYRANEQDFIGKTPNMLFHDDLEQKRQVWRQFLDSGQLHVETDERRLDGSKISVLGNYTFLYDNEGRIIGHFAIQIDISNRKQAEEKAEHYNKTLQKKSRLLEMILDNAPVGIWLNNAQEEMIFMNKFGRDHFNLSEQELAVCQQTDRETACMDGPQHYEEVVTFKDNKQHIVKTVKNKITGSDGSLLGILAIGLDVTKQKEVVKALQQSEERYRMLLEHATQSIVVVQQGVLKFCNPLTVKLTGYELDELIGNPLIDFIHPHDAAIVQDNYIRSLAGEKMPHYEFRILHKNGAFCWLEISSILIEWDGEAAVLSFISDITDRKMKEQEIKYYSYHDHLTDLYNRRYYEEALKGLDQQKHLPLTLILADVNGLKLTNDAFGHLAGDRLLQTIASALKSVCRKSDVVARIGGDEFVLLLPSTSTQAAEQVVHRLREEISRRQSGQVAVSLSLGWATKTDVMEEISRIYMQAEDMMYNNKLTESLQMKRATLDMIIYNLYEQSSEEEQHSKRVSALCEQTGIALGLESQQVNELRGAGLMHDIGKIGINITTLYKHEPLTEAEELDSVRHPEIGHHILSALPEYGEIARIVLAHHEHWDGSGYPKGLSGQNIPLASRIIHIAGAYDTMVNGINYHEPWGEAEAIEELRRMAGKQFDPAVVEVFVEQVLPYSRKT